MSIKNVVKPIEEQIEQLHTEMIESDNQWIKSGCRSLKKDLFRLRYVIKFGSDLEFWLFMGKLRADIESAINSQRRKYDQDPTVGNRYGLQVEIKRRQYIRWVHDHIDQAVA